MEWTEAELIELYEERAAIREYDGGLTQQQAEQAAYYDLRQLVGNQVKVPAYITERARKFGVSQR